jgi:hypothetical protein
METENTVVADDITSKEEDKRKWESLKVKYEQPPVCVGTLENDNTRLKEENEKLRLEFSKLTLQSELCKQQENELRRQISDLQEVKIHMMEQWLSMYSSDDVIRHIVSSYIHGAVRETVSLMQEVADGGDSIDMNGLDEQVDAVMAALNDNIEDIVDRGCQCAEMIIDFLKFYNEEYE